MNQHTQVIVSVHLTFWGEFLIDNSVGIKQNSQKSLDSALLYDTFFGLEILDHFTPSSSALWLTLKAPCFMICHNGWQCLEPYQLLFHATTAIFLIFSQQVQWKHEQTINKFSIKVRFTVGLVIPVNYLKSLAEVQESIQKMSATFWTFSLIQTVSDGPGMDHFQCSLYQFKILHLLLRVPVCF